jgi:hypothetical protein
MRVPLHLYWPHLHENFLNGGGEGKLGLADAWVGEVAQISAVKGARREYASLPVHILVPEPTNKSPVLAKKARKLA